MRIKVFKTDWKLFYPNRNKNKKRKENDPTLVDLHGLHCDEAVEVLEEILLQAEHRMFDITFLHYS